MQGFVGKRALPILQCGLNDSIAWPVVRVHSANPPRYPDGPLYVNVWDVWREAGALTVTLQQEEVGEKEANGKKEVNIETTTHKRVRFSEWRGKAGD